MLKFGSFILSIMICTASLHSEMARIHSFSEAHPIIETLDKDSLVVFDVDRVLIEYEDAVLHAHNNPIMREIIVKHAQDLGLNTVQEQMSTMQYQARPKLIEQEVKDLIYSLQQKNVPVIALTATPIGSIPKIGSIQDWRIARLKDLGLTFSFQEMPFHSFSELTGMGPSPVFKEGILFSATYSKGAVLKSFLQKINWKPQTVVFFDDYTINVQTVHTEMHALGVERVFSFHYLGAEKWLQNLDYSLAESQIRHLLEHREWLSETCLKARIPPIPTP